MKLTSYCLVSKIQKHLGLLISSDCKLTKQIDDFIENVSKQFNVLRRMKFR